MELLKGYFVTAEIHVKNENNIDLAKEQLKKLRKETLKEEGCTIFSIHQSNENPDIFIMWERFENESAYKKHFEYEHTKKYISLNLTEVIQFFQTDLI